MTVSVSPQTLHNGKSVGFLPLEDRGWSLGDALFETILVRRGEPVWLDEHLDRLAVGCQRLALDCCVSSLRADIATVLEGFPGETGVLRLCVSRDSLGQRGYRIASRKSHRYCQLTALGAPQRLHWEQGIRAFVAKTRLPEQVQLAGLKHTNRLPHILARAERDAGAFPEGLVLSVSGQVVEGISSNCFIAVDGALQTPLLDRAGVSGIVRQKVIECARGQGIAVKEARLTFADIARADELFFCNSLVGLWPVRQLDCLFYSSFSLCQRVQRELESVWYD